MAAKPLLLCLTLGLVYHVESFGPKAGPYNVDIEKAELCENQGTGKVVFGTRITKVGRHQYIYQENFTVGVPVDEHLKLHIEAQKWGNGGWRPKAMQHTFKNCEALWKVGKNCIKKMMKSAGVDVEKCPIPAGNYKANNVTVGFAFEKTVPVMEYAKYRIIGHGYYKDELIACMMIYVELTPKDQPVQ